MKDAARQTRSYLMELFSQHGFNPRTDLGQNFLIDLNLVEYIVDQGQLETRDVVLEIGSGTGGMTAFLSRRAGHVVSVELDRNVHRLAARALAGETNVTLLNCDALHNKNRLNETVLENVRRELAAAPGRRLKLVANLPYSVATPVISNLVASELPWSGMVVTIQWELAQRMTARPGRSHYGSLSVWLQAQCRVKILKRLSPAVFWPRPKVNSAIVRLLPDPRNRARIQDRAFLLDFVRRLFHQRRKTLRSMLVGMYRKQMPKDDVDGLLARFGAKETVRAEELTVQELVRLANLFQEHLTRAAAPGN